MYAFCHSCGHEAGLFDKGAGKFVLFCPHGEIRTTAHFNAHYHDEIDFECPKCSGTHVTVNDWLVRKRS